MNKIHTLVIGGTSGIGSTVATAFSNKGHLVSVIGWQPKKNFRMQAEVHYWFVDLAKSKKLKAVLKEIIAKNGALDNLIFMQRYRGKADDWKGEIETSLSATKFIIEALSGKFKEQGVRSVVMMSSVAASYVAAEQPLSYHAAKAALNQMVRFYAVALGEKGIRVNAVSSGTIVKEESKDFYAKNKKLNLLYTKVIPLGRMGTAEDIAAVIGFLCSTAAGFITGQNILVDGGASLVWQEALARKLTQLENIKVTR